jgi:hypothetical protein
MYRWQSLSLFASASFPACASTTTTGLMYTWRFYKNSVLSTQKSTSSNQRYFKLEAYTLDRSTSYSAIVSVAFTSNSAVTLSSGIWILQTNLQ